MVNLKRLQKSLSNYTRPPVEQWNPPFCGDIEICIASDGKWLYQNSEISRPALVKLFASVLWREGDDYFLKTPAEKVRIKVEDLPFIVIGWELKDDGYIEVVTNTDERYKLSDRYSLIIAQDAPAIEVRDGFLARVHRNVYYQWAEIASPALEGEEPGFYLQSADIRFFLGPAS